VRESSGFSKPEGAMKVKVAYGRPGKIPFLHKAGALPARPSGSFAGRSKSAHAGTRKMVNYVRVGRSQRKL